MLHFSDLTLQNSHIPVFVLWQSHVWPCSLEKKPVNEFIFLYYVSVF